MAAETVNVVLAVANITADPAPAVSMVSYFCDTTGGGFDVTVPNVADVTDGIQIRVTLSVGVSTVVVTTVGGTDLIGTATSQAITQAGTGITIQANAGSGKWEIVQDSRGMGQNRGNTLYVDAVFGNDGTALPDRADLPYLTPEAAKVAASTGDLIEVRSGDYVVTTNLAKDGVNWHLMEGANITFNASDGVSLFGDQGSAVVFSIGGLGSIRVELPTGSFTSHGFDTSNAGSSITAELLDLVISADSFNNDFCDLVHQEGGRIAIKCRDFLVTGAARSYGIWWTDGPMSLRARNMISDTTSGVAFCSFVSVNHPAGEAYVFADIIDSTNNMGDCIVQGVQEEATPTADSTAKVWITAGQIKGTDQDLISAIGKGNGGNLYVTTQKVTGYVVDYGEHGTFYLDTMKHQPIAGIGADQLHLEGFKSFINIGEVLDANIGGTYGTVSAGTHTLTINDCTRAFNGNGIDVSGGTLRLNDSRIDTSVDSTSSPISKTGGVLELKGTELVAEATADSIASDAPQDVTSRGSTVNTAVGSDITNLGDLFYDQGGPADDQVPTANADGTWSWADPGGGAGDVTGPASAVADNIALFDGTTGKTIKDAGINLSEIVEEDPGAGVGMIESGTGVSPIILKNIKDGIATQVVSNTGSIQVDVLTENSVEISGSNRVALVGDEASPGNSEYYGTNGAGTKGFYPLPTDTGITELTGDVTAGPGSGSQAATIANNAVTFAKMQTVSVDVLLGNDSAGTAVEEIACTAAGRAILDDATAADQLTTIGVLRATLSSTFVTNSTTFVDVTGMTITVPANKTALFRMYVPYNSAATTVGIGLSMTVTGSPTTRSFNRYTPTNATGTPVRANIASDDAGAINPTTGSAGAIYGIEMNGVVKAAGSACVVQLRMAVGGTPANVTLNAGGSMEATLMD